MAHHAKVHNSSVVEGDQCLEQEVCITAGHPLVEMYVTNWVKAQREDLMLSAVLDWLKVQKQTNLKMLLAEQASSEEGNLIINRILQFIRGSCTYTQCPKAKLKISCSSWSPRHIMWLL